MRHIIGRQSDTIQVIVLACLVVWGFALLGSLWYSGYRPYLLPRMLPQPSGQAQSGGGGTLFPPESPISGNPTYSPDGREIAFVSDRVGGRLVCPHVCAHIWIIGVDGRNLRQVAADMSLNPAVRSHEQDPVWSPDGSRIAFTSTASGNLDIWVVRIDGSDLTRLTTDPADDKNPAWSPDGSQIAFASNRSGSRQIWIMNADGTNPRQVTSVVEWGPGTEPSFSPDGSQLVFVAAPPGITHGVSRPNLMIMNVDGTGLRVLTEGAYYDFQPRWSTRGIVFNSDRAGGDTAGLWLIQPDGSGLKFITAATPGPSTVSSDGTKVAFNSYQGGIYEFNFLDGTTRPLTQFKGFAISIDIRPGVFPNTIDPRSDSRIPVAILSTPGFHPAQIVQASITFGPTGDESSPASCSNDEVNGDRVLDLVCHFDIAHAFSPTVTEGILRAMTNERQIREGRDSVQVLP